MPALVNSRVGSLAGKRGLERTRVWPCRSKYCKNFSRISLPFMIEGSLACEKRCAKFGEISCATKVATVESINEPSEIAAECSPGREPRGSAANRFVSPLERATERV